MTRVMAMEWARYGVTVNTLAPGAVDTALVKKMHDAETRQAHLQSIPMGRYGVPKRSFRIENRCESSRSV